MAAASLIVALGWIFPFAVGGRFRLGASPSRRAWLSAAGGTAIACVFVDVGPFVTGAFGCALLPLMLG
jgi:hypothetical protein